MDQRIGGGCEIRRNGGAGRADRKLAHAVDAASGGGDLRDDRPGGSGRGAHRGCRRHPYRGASRRRPVL